MWIWVAIVALLTLLFFGCSREGLKGWKTQENSTDYYGYDIAGSPTKKDVAACASSCAANSSCNLTVTDVATGTGNCWLKTKPGTKSTPSNRFARQLSTVAEGATIRCESNASALNTTSASVFKYNNNAANLYPSEAVANFWDPKWNQPNSASYVDCAGITKGANMTKPSVWTQEMNINHTGTDLKTTSMTTPDACLTECINTPACKGTVFNGSKCWLKSTIGTKTATTGVHSYMKAPPMAAPEGWTLVPDSNYAGGDLSSLTGWTMQACTDQCKSNSDCKGVVFDTHDDKCYLKKTIGTRSVFNGAHSYVKPMAAPTGWIFEANTDHAGNDSPQLENSTPEACWAACNGDPACKGFGFDTRLTNGAPNNKCFLKSAISTKSTLNNFNFYLKPEAAPIPVTTTEGDWTKKTNTAYPNPDGKTVVGTFQNLTDADCKTKCAATNSCKGFTNYAYNAGGSSCLLMSTTDGDFNYTKNGETATSYKYNSKPPDPAPAGWTLEAGTNYSGNDIKGIDNSTAAACETACVETVGCKGTVFDTTASKCWLKSSLANKTAQTNTNTYKRPDPTLAQLPGWQLAVDSDYAGDNLSTLENSSSVACTAACDQNTDCKGATFNYRNGMCSLKKAMPTKSVLAGTDSYLKPAALAGWTLEVGTNYSGNDLKSIANSSAEACSQACLETPECKGTVFDTTDSICWLKSALANKTAQSNTNAYLKPAAMPAPAGWTLETDVRYDGTYTETPGMNATDCLDSCATTDGCLGMGFDATSVCRKYSAFSDTKSTVAGYNTYKNSTPYKTPTTDTRIVDPVVKPAPDILPDGTRIVDPVVKPAPDILPDGTRIVDPVVKPPDKGTRIVDPVIKPPPFKLKPQNPEPNADPSYDPTISTDVSTDVSTGPVAYNQVATFLGFTF